MKIYKKICAGLRTIIATRSTILEQRAEIKRLKDKLYDIATIHRDRCDRLTADWRAELNAETQENAKQRAEIKRLKVELESERTKWDETRRY